MTYRTKGRLATTAAALLIVLFAALVWVAAAPAESASPAPDTVTLRVGWLEEPDNLNPFIGIQGTSYMVWHLNYDFLVGFDPKTMAPRPELATAWEVSDDGKTWTFTIRSDATWQDGEPVTARDVAFTFNYINDNELLNLAVYTDGITTAEAVDDTTVKITTSAPKANMLKMVVPILPEHVWSKISGKDAGNSFQNPPPIIGSGPFQVVDFKKGKYVKLQANKDYWGGAPKIDELLLEAYTNPDTMASDLKLGAIDGAIDVPLAQFESLGNAPGLTTNQAVSWRFTELAMNCYDSKYSKGNPVLLDQKFREAVNWAVDRDKVVEVAEQGYATVGSSLIVPTSKYHWEPPEEMRFTYDPEKAKQILDEAGYKDVNGDGMRETKDGKKLVLRCVATTDATDNQTAGKLIVDWLRDVGIKLDFQVVDAGTLIDYQYAYDEDSNYAPDWDMFIWYWTQDVDPQFMLSIYTPQQIEGWNDCLWTDPEYTKLNDEQSQTIDEAARQPIIEQMQEIFYKGAAYAILTYPAQLEAYNTGKWQGWVPVPGEAAEGQQGTVLYSYNNIDTYRFVEPKAATESSGGGGSNTTLIVVIVVVLVVVAGAVVVLLRRSGGRAETE